MLALPRAPFVLRAVACCARALIAALAVAALLWPRVSHAQIELPAGNLADRITVDADEASYWKEGVYDVYLLRGHCFVNQGLTYARSSEAVVWIERGNMQGDPPHKLLVYLEGDVQINYQQATGDRKATGAAELRDKRWFGRFHSMLPIDVRPKKIQPEPAIKPEVYQHAVAARNPASSGVKAAQFAESIPAPPAVVGPPPGTVRVRIQPRSGVRPDVQTVPINPATNEFVAIINSGVNIVIDGLDDFGAVDVETDRLVIWTEGQLGSDAAGQSFQAKDRPLEIYMEGNVVFRQGDRTIYADRMYYDVRRQVGIVLSAEVLTPVPNYQGLLKLRAEVLQMTGRDHFLAQQASLTSSRFGVPGYELRAGLMTYDDVQRPRINPFTGQPEVSITGEPIIDHEKQATSSNNLIYVEQVPVFYWPFLATDLDKPNFYVDSVRVKNDRIFGTQVYTDIDTYQLLGIRNRLPGTKWVTSADYLSKRGPAGGTTFNYERQTLFGIPESTSGFVDAWSVFRDRGLDNLGLDRRNFIPEKDFRYRVLAQHRQQLPNNFQLTGEFGVISDRNFLEQYFEREWDQLKDQTTDIELKQYRDNSSWSVFGSARLNPFFTETQWLPRFDHFWLGQPLLNDRLTWYEHSSAAYAVYQTASAPPFPPNNLNWAPLPYDVPGKGERFATRQELDFPFSVGAVKFDPYVIGELAHWGQALDQNDENRAYGAGGIRATLPLWSVDPSIRSTLLNLNGLAHKVTFETDISYARSSQRVTDFQLYDPIDDNDIEAYRRWFAFTDFGGPPPVPTRFDERLYGVRRGLGNWVASPTTEIADNLFAARLAMKQRWQTKRGPIANPRIIDWITFNTDVTLFPNPNRDNFGEVVGLFDYDFRWHVGDRTTVVSEAYMDFFSQAPQYFTIGGFLNRPPRGSLYVGFRSLNGPITSNVIATNYIYRMSPKWLSTFGTTFDIHNSRNIGQNFTITRIGESFLFSFNINVDTSKGNVGANVAIQPRFLQGRLGPPSGVILPAAGVYGLE